MKSPYQRSESGATSVEYALLAALIAVVIIASVTVLGGKTSGLFTKTCNSLSVHGGGTAC